MNDSSAATPARLLPTLQSPADVKALSAAQLPLLAEEIRRELIAVTSRNGGHIGPNLGVVELTIALHRIFNTPEDQLVFDVAHQGYVHKLLTGRGGDFFQNLRQTGGASGFLARGESLHDAFGAGHAGTALSAALGMATARDLRGTAEHVIAICGDAAFTCGITLEALNNVVSSTKRLIVILNDNEWSIAKNVGAMANYLNRLSTNPTYNKLHHDVEAFFTSFPAGVEMNRFYQKWKRETKDFFVESSLFEKFGLRYLGPVDGHNFEALAKNLEFAKHCDVPVLVHVLTKKGKGLDAALIHPEKFHGASPFNPLTGESTKSTSVSVVPNYQDVLGQALARFALADTKIVGVTAAMPSGTGLSHLAKAAPQQFFDVGIAEEHAVLFAAGMATKGIKPVCAIYSTFLQRAYDQIIHDVALQNLPVTFCLDRAGLSPNDGPTHHGLFDLAYLRCVPNATVMQPKDEDELVDMLHTSLQLGSPAFLRYPRGAGVGVKLKSQPVKLPIGQAEVLRQGSNIMLWALGPMVQEALALAQRLETEENLSVGVVNARFVKPLDRTLLLSQAACIPLLVTMEDHAVTGGFGSAVLETLQEANCTTAVERIGWPDKFIEHGSNVTVLREAHGLGADAIYRRVLDRWRHLRAETVAADA
ncbi:1-deoxy-D-xylulose-5-phosphate synthase [Opitutus terrae]|uniref:1-deoxy-D-xylulose-5-phosphate synthase n=1 Tax=Opitutus terrae (strain DSM 11246 / JCM 15787 / PB90-1) TaxID=452637 RepID=B1ZW47_OPITP|nr:1-deoxy-D-xylulose-5-phosphate synthase [Opitutus terrae]ACB76061.1 deoxyxylulose-5-phosphate synthase [Opitutus terrae PB90-1]